MTDLLLTSKKMLRSLTDFLTITTPAPIDRNALREQVAIMRARGKLRWVMRRDLVIDAAKREQLNEQARNTPYFDKMRKIVQK